MANVLTLPQIRRFSGLVAFSRRELGQLLSLYGARVSSGEWRDYAVDHLQGMAVFSVFRHSHENPIFSIVKIQPQQHNKPPTYLVVSGAKTLTQQRSLPEAIAIFDDEDFEKFARSIKPGHRHQPHQ